MFPTRLPLATCLAMALSAAGAETVVMRALDEHGRTAAVRIRLRDAAGRLHAPRVVAPAKPLAAHPRFPDLGVIVTGECSLEVPGSGFTVEVDRGTEYVPQSLPAKPGPLRQIRLKRWIDMAERGWWSADLHVHRLPTEMPLLLEASGLNFAPVITKWNLNTNLDVWPDQPVVRLSASQYYSVDNAEDERPWGAALFFSLRTPMALYNVKSEWPPPAATWSEARRKGGFVDQEKVIWWAAPVMAALVPPDSIGVANNHFLEEGMLDSEAWGRPRDRGKYPGFEGFTQYIFDLYYTYLSAGLRIPASAGSANGVLKNPLGYSRSYAFLGEGFAPETWFTAQKAGRNFVTNGPVLFLSANGQTPGAVLAPGTRTARIEITAISHEELEKAELIVNGRVARAFTPGRNGSRLRAAETIAVADGDWIAARCFEKNARTVRFAHTSPVYISGEPRRDPEALARLREWIDLYMERIRELPSTALTDAQKEQWLTQCRKARETYR